MKNPDWFNGAVPSFGNPKSTKLLVMGLAPGMHGANKTGRPFTGDASGDLLFATLIKFGFATGSYGGAASDNVKLVDTMITNAVRCVPPANRPTAAEMTNCRPFLVDRIASLKQLRAIVALGRVAHDSILTAFSLRKSAYKFVHGEQHEVGDGILLFDSYHCSRYNTNTGRLTTDMFEDVFRSVRTALR